MWFRYGRGYVVLPLIGTMLSGALLLAPGPFYLPYGLVLTGFAAIMTSSVAGLLVLAASLLLWVRALSWFGILDDQLTWMVLGLQQRLKARSVIEVERIHGRSMYGGRLTRVVIRGEGGSWAVTDRLLDFDEFCRELSRFCARHGTPIYDRQSAWRRSDRVRIPSL
jgi:hypothetical protein